MRILLLGASGYIGRHLTADVLAAGHTVRAAIRRPYQMKRIFPNIATVACDLAQDVETACWRPRLVGIDAVINAAGVLRGRQSAAIHCEVPAALYQACVEAGVRRVVHISAISADDEAATDYARTKHAGEEALKALDLDWVILRPSLVYGPGSHGGTSLLRGLAGLPLVLPLPEGGKQRFQPIHMDDLTRSVRAALEQPRFAQTILQPVGPETMTLAEILRAWRAWLGLPPQHEIAVPRPLVRLAGRLGDLGGDGPLSTVALRQLDYGNVGDPQSFAAAIGFTPMRMAEALQRHPATVQDKWHARLYVLRPLIRYGLAALWIVSGLIGFFATREIVAGVASRFELGGAAGNYAAWAACLADVAMGIGIAARLRTPQLLMGQIGLIAGYTAVLTYARAGLWLDPFGPLTKNAAVLLLVLVWAILEDDR